MLHPVSTQTKDPTDKYPAPLASMPHQHWMRVMGCWFVRCGRVCNTYMYQSGAGIIPPISLLSTMACSLVCHRHTIKAKSFGSVSLTLPPRNDTHYPTFGRATKASETLQECHIARHVALYSQHCQNACTLQDQQIVRGVQETILY